MDRLPEIWLLVSSSGVSALENSTSLWNECTGIWYSWILYHPCLSRWCSYQRFHGWARSSERFHYRSGWLDLAENYGKWDHKHIRTNFSSPMMRFQRLWLQRKFLRLTIFWQVYWKLRTLRLVTNFCLKTSSLIHKHYCEKHWNQTNS
jgi:hypothetical protein